MKDAKIWSIMFAKKYGRIHLTVLSLIQLLCSADTFENHVNSSDDKQTLQKTVTTTENQMGLCDGFLRELS
jgi:hypothetical protein